MIGQRPRTNIHKRPPTIELSRGQVKVLADRLAPLAAGRTHEQLATEIGVKTYVVMHVLKRSSKVTMPRTHLDALAGKLGIDVGGWDVSTT